MPKPSAPAVAPAAQRAINGQPQDLAALMSAQAAPAPPPLPARIEPTLGADGQALEQAPPVAGRWLRHADGGLGPADADTADAAGLARPG